MNKSFFLKQFFHDFKHTGAVSPSSKSLTLKMLRSVDFSKALHIAELGPGTGSFTHEIVNRMGTGSMLSCFEINPYFRQSLAQYEKNAGFALYSTSALTFSQKLKNELVDYVISGLPLANFSKEDILQIFEEVKKVLKPGGQFIQFQYTPKLERLFKKHFKVVKKRFVFFNLPPALVYQCND